MPRTVLIVDDSAVCRGTVRRVLEAAGYVVVELASPFGFSQVLNRERPDLALIDLDLPAITGDQLIAIARGHKLHRCPMLLYSSAPRETLKRVANESGAVGYVMKEADHQGLLDAVARFAPIRRESP